jgi:glutamate 5-kinase
LVDAELLILLTDQLGLYTADPRHTPNATLIPVVEQIDERIFALAGGTSTGLGTGGMITKLQAAQLAGRSGTTTVIASGGLHDVLLEIAQGRSVGTTFLPSTPHRESHKRWLHSQKAQGTLTVDAGAATHLRKRGASLLPVGVTSAAGDFERGAPVRVLSPDGAAIALGITNYSADEVRQLIGVQSAQIEAILGYVYSEEIIHRDNLALL